MVFGNLDFNAHNVAVELVVQLTSTMFTLIQATENLVMEAILKIVNNFNLFLYFFHL